MFISDNGMIHSKDKVHIFIEVEKDIKGYSIKEKRMDKEYIGILMGQSMMVDGWMIKKMDLVNSDIQMVIYMRVIGLEEWNQDKEL